MKITALKRRKNRIRVHIDGGEEPRVELAEDLVVRERLAVGDPLDPDRLAALEAEDEILRAREAALRLLAHRARSEAELRRRLERKEFAPPIVAQTLGWLEERGYVDDAAFAASFVRDRLRLRPRGRVALLQELRRKGVAADVAEAAVEGTMRDEEVDEAGLALEAAESWARRNRPVIRTARGGDPEQRLRARRRLYGHLARRGFAPDAVRAAVAAVLGD